MVSFKSVIVGKVNSKYTNMRIWFDISNSPHVNLFYDLIKDLEGAGHEIIITTRPLANTIDLLKQKGLRYSVIGEHYGKSFFKKMLGYPIRVFQLIKYLKKYKPDLAVSQSSFHSPLVAKVLGVPSIYTNDNEHALGNIASFLFATKILLPESYSLKKAIKHGASKKKIMLYPGLKEGIYLWRLGEEISSRRRKGIECYFEIYIRPEPLTAQYYKGGINFLDDAIEKLQSKYSITVLPRDKKQLQHYSQTKFSSIGVPVVPLKFSEIAQRCSLFIGAGGSMTRELAILGIPTISVYQDELLEVDRFLINKKRMYYEPSFSAELAESYIKRLRDADLDTELLKKGKQAYELFKGEILKFCK